MSKNDEFSSFRVFGLIHAQQESNARQGASEGVTPEASQQNAMNAKASTPQDMRAAKKTRTVSGNKASAPAPASEIQDLGGSSNSFTRDVNGKAHEGDENVCKTRRSRGKGRLDSFGTCSGWEREQQTEFDQLDISAVSGRMDDSEAGDANFNANTTDRSVGFGRYSQDVHDHQVRTGHDREDSDSGDDEHKDNSLDTKVQRKRRQGDCDQVNGPQSEGTTKNRRARSDGNVQGFASPQTPAVTSTGVPTSTWSNHSESSEGLEDTPRDKRKSILRNSLTGTVDKPDDASQDRREDTGIHSVRFSDGCCNVADTKPRLLVKPKVAKKHTMKTGKKQIAQLVKNITAEVKKQAALSRQQQTADPRTKSKTKKGSDKMKNSNSESAEVQPSQKPAAIDSQSIQEYTEKRYMLDDDVIVSDRLIPKTPNGVKRAPSRKSSTSKLSSSLDATLTPRHAARALKDSILRDESEPHEALRIQDVSNEKGTLMQQTPKATPKSAVRDQRGESRYANTPKPKSESNASGADPVERRASRGASTPKIKKRRKLYAIQPFIPTS
jgi:hypothetical protein